jgi:uroporphyrinogen-III synthase
VVYRQEPLDLTEEAQQLLNRGDPVVVPLFSARTARLFFSQITATRGLRIAAISEAVAMGIPEIELEQIKIASEPTLDSMVAAICALASDT